MHFNTVSDADVPRSLIEAVEACVRQQAQDLRR
jgi:hypothetical protein